MGFVPTKAFFVPKMCNHCRATPCMQVCPVGASYRTKDGVVLVDTESLHRLRLLRAGLPVRKPLHPPETTHTADEVHLVLPPHHQGAEAGLRDGLPHARRASSATCNEGRTRCG